MVRGELENDIPGEGPLVVYPKIMEKKLFQSSPTVTDPVVVATFMFVGRTTLNVVFSVLVAPPIVFVQVTV
jgi:hypothetical protein